MLWAELRVSLVKFYGLLRPPTTSPANSIKEGVAKVGARLRVRLRQVLQLSSGSRLAFPAELTSMFALPAADIHVCRAISSPRFAEPAGSSCTIPLAQPCATPMGAARDLTADLTWSILIHGQRPADDVHVVRAASSPRITVNFKLRSTSRSRHSKGIFQGTERGLSKFIFISICSCRR